MAFMRRLSCRTARPWTIRTKATLTGLSTLDRLLSSSPTAWTGFDTPDQRGQRNKDSGGWRSLRGCEEDTVHETWIDFSRSGHIIGLCLLSRTEKMVNVLPPPPSTKLPLHLRSQLCWIAQPNQRIGLSVLPQCNSYTALLIVYCKYSWKHFTIL